MKILLTIKDEDVRPGVYYGKDEDNKIRISPRAVLFDRYNKIALLHVSRDNYYKLPGGGADKDENIEEALKRECLEETGCNVEIDKEIGEVVEYRNKWKQTQKSSCFVAHVVGDKGQPNFEKSEIAEGFELMWVGFDQALNLVKNSQPEDNPYDAKFIVKRDRAILEAAQKLINKS